MKLKCFLQGHESRYQVKPNGQRVFHCDRCGHEEPQINRDGELLDWLKARQTVVSLTRRAK